MRTVFIVAAVLVAGVLGFSLLQDSSDASSDVKVVVFKTPSCGCCGEWVEHMQEAGFEVDVRDLDNLSGIKDQYAVPRQMRTCHTALVNGYVVEGHVPARFVRKLLDERPEVAGIAVPGMPIGSPGMEVEGRPNAAYDVMAFNASGESAVFGHVAGDEG